MMAAWMLYTIVVGTLLAAAAWIADAACGLLHWPRRGGWVLALAGTVALALAPLLMAPLGADAGAPTLRRPDSSSQSDSSSPRTPG